MLKLRTPYNETKSSRMGSAPGSRCDSHGGSLMIKKNLSAVESSDLKSTEQKLKR